ncbi:MAG: TonB-dependent receptor [Gammaproteobacteria bacterium]|nr:TonB-dependent receptor [Gammaproteobacteria bacterium]
MTLQKIILAVALTLFVTNVQAEAFRITVLEKGTGDPVEGATVVNKQTSDYDTTDMNGRMTLDDVTFPFDLKVLNIGYETLEQSVSEKELTIYLEPLTFEGEALEVVTERVKEKTSKITLVQEELRRVPGTQGDPIKMIETLPGVVTSSGGGDGGGNPNNIYVRGSSGGENSFWINKLQAEYLYHFWGISIVNPSLVKDFNIFLGGFPVEYNDVLGGVVDIQLRDPKTDRLHQTYRVALNESAALLEGPITENQSFYAAARISYIDKVLDPFIEDIIAFLSDDEDETDISVITLPKYWDAQANWHYKLPRGSADLYYFGSGDALALKFNKLENSDPELLGKLSAEFGFHTLGMNLQNSFSPKLVARLTSSLKRDYTRFQIGTDENGDPYGVDVSSTSGLVSPVLLWTPTKNHEFSLGTSTTYIKLPINLNISSLPSEENFSGDSFTSQEKFQVDDNLTFVGASPYLKWRWTWDKLNTILGLRYSKVRGTGGIDMEDYTPRIAFEYQATDDLLLNASWGRYMQIPNGAQLVRGYGNPKLGFTFAEHRIVGMQYRFADLWTVQLEGYHKPMEKLVLTHPFQSPPDLYQNDGEGEAYGIDLLIKRDYGNRTMGWLSYSYARSSRTLIDGSDRNFSADQPHTISAVWSQPFGGNWNKWTWGFKLQANSGQPYTPIVGRIAYCGDPKDAQVCADQEIEEGDPEPVYWNPILGERNILRRAFSHQLDFRIDRLIRYNTWTMTVYLDLLNVTMQTQPTYDYGKNYEDYNNPKESGVPGIIFPFLGVEASF